MYSTTDGNNQLGKIEQSPDEMCTLTNDSIHLSQGSQSSALKTITILYS